MGNGGWTLHDSDLDRLGRVFLTVIDISRSNVEDLCMPVWVLALFEGRWTLPE